MTTISECVETLSTEQFPYLVTGWPRKERYREVRAEIECQDCGHNSVDRFSMRGEPEPSDFQDWCDECGSHNVEGKIIDDEELEDKIDEFSRSNCDCCGTDLAGARYAVTGLPANPSENHDYIPYEVCAECYFYIATGEELE